MKKFKKDPSRKTEGACSFRLPDDMDYTGPFVLFLTSLINITNDIKERRIQAIKEKLKSLSARERAEIKMALSEIFEEDA